MIFLTTSMVSMASSVPEFDSRPEQVNDFFGSGSANCTWFPRHMRNPCRAYVSSVMQSLHTPTGKRRYFMYLCIFLIYC